jgi:predicted NUDIX family NTP pyrophosphohydrolase
MAGTAWEIPEGLVFKNESGQTVAAPYISTEFGAFSWTGAPINVTRYKPDGTTEVVVVPVPTEAQLKLIFDSNAAFASYISPPDAYAGAPWMT